MRVTLLHYTPLGVAIVAIRTCYASLGSSDSHTTPFGEYILGERDKALIRKITDNGHTSTLEHLNYTFLIEGISRACSHQLVRHRIASYSQQSQRYVKHNCNEFVVPDTTLNEKFTEKLYKDALYLIEQAYNYLIEKGVPKEDARYILPNAATTKLVMTINARSLLNFFSLRLDKKSQWEIRQLAEKMLHAIPEQHRFIFETVTKGYSGE